MRQTPIEQELNSLQREFTRMLNDGLNILDGRLTVLEQPAFQPTSYVSPPNYIPNSHPEWSTDAYLNAGVSTSTGTTGSPGDINRECYNWFYQLESATDLSAASPVLASGHSGYAGLDADAPVWDRLNGTFLIGGSGDNYDISCPLPTDFVFPGQKFYVYFEVSLASGTINKGSSQVYFGFWDNTSGQRKFIEGADFTPSITVQGAVGSRTLSYKILAETDTGEQILSDEIQVTNAPATLSANDHIRLYFTGAPGFIRYVIYRYDGTNYYRVADIRNSIDLQFFDIQETGSSVVRVDGYPSITTQRPRAYAKTYEFTPGSLSSTDFQAHTLVIQVPLTYDRSQTANGSQYLRFGLDNIVAAGNERGIVIRRISVSEGYGSWTRSPRDMQALSSPSTGATSAPAPGQTTPVPPHPGTGGPTCVTLDTIVERVCPKTGKVEEVPISEIQTGHYLRCGTNVLYVQCTLEGTVQKLLRFKTANGKELYCSEEHRLIKTLFDRFGSTAKHLKVGDTLLTFDKDFVVSDIIEAEEIVGEAQVKTVRLISPHLFLTNGIVSHNNKQQLPELPSPPEF